jgi:ubiquitin-protein ligase
MEGSDMSNPKQVRLQTDFEKVKNLVANSGRTLRLVHSTGTPPTLYVIEYNCPSLVKDMRGNLMTRNQHQVEINLSANYPFEKPSARMITPIFNPHVFSNNSICLGVVWSPAETLDSLILRIGALLQLDPRVLDQRSPANGEANRWVQLNRAKLPLGNVTFKVESPTKKRIEWS